MGCVCAQYAQCLSCTAIWHVCVCVCVHNMHNACPVLPYGMSVCVSVCAQYAQCLPCTAIWHVCVCVCVCVCAQYAQCLPCTAICHVCVCVCVCTICTMPALYCHM